MALVVNNPLIQNLKHPGVPVRLNGKNYYIPSLSVKDYRAHEEEISARSPEDVKLSASFDLFIPIIGKAIRRNYPEVSDEQLEDWMDLHSFSLAIKAVSAASGLTPVIQGE
jgi:hypothetical protein